MNPDDGFQSRSPEISGAAAPAPKKKSEQSSVFLYTIVALGLALFIRFFVAAPYVVQGQSMEPYFDDWHYLIIDRLSLRLGEPERGEIIIFELPADRSRSLIKRVIGLPGETVTLRNRDVIIMNDEHPEGFTLEEPYLDPANVTPFNSMRIELGPGQYFVMGDNRRVSSDSRLWGALPRENIVGRAILRLYPFDKVGILPGDATGINQ
jgi:signal peptidase I